MPPNPFTSVTVTVAPGATLNALTVRTAGGSIENVRAPDVPPPGAGVKTATFAVPTATRSLAGIDAWIVVVFTTVVGRSLPFHRTTEKPSNPLPVRVSVNDVMPARPFVGDIAVTTGCGF